MVPAGQPERGAATTDFELDLVALGIESEDAPEIVQVEVSRDANNTLQVEVTGDKHTWRADVRSKPQSLEPVFVNRDGAFVRTDSLPDWFSAVLAHVNVRLTEGSA